MESAVEFHMGVKLLGPETLFSSLKQFHSFARSLSHLGLMHRHEHLPIEENSGTSTRYYGALRRF